MEGRSLWHKEFKVKGTEAWEHFPVSDFLPGDTLCRDKPFVAMSKDYIVPGIHSQVPWTPRVWWISAVNYIERWDLLYDGWFEPKWRNAANTVQKYIR